MVPGHEIVGIVTGVGPEVTRYRVGDRVAVGCLVDSCQKCGQCSLAMSSFLPRARPHLQGPDRRDRTLTKGGYSDHVIVRQEFVLSLPDSLDISRAAPLLCAGITTYSPLRKYGVGPGKKVGVAGLGGLGHMGVKIRPCARRSCHDDHHLARQGRGCPRAWRRRCAHLQGSGERWRRQRGVRLHPRHHPGRARNQPLPQFAYRMVRWCWSERSNRCPASTAARW